MNSEKLVKALVAADDARPRSSQGAGISSLGDCARRVFHVLRGDAPVNPDVERLPAILGTAIHKVIEDATDGDGLNEVEVRLPQIDLVGHVDRIDGTRLVDYKTTTKKSLGFIKAHGPSRNQRWQIHAGALAWNIERDAFDEPEFIETVSLIYIPRDGRSKDILEWEEPYDEAAALEAVEWMAGVQDAVQSGRPPEPEKHFSFCRDFCQFWGSLCPGLDVSDPLAETDDPWSFEAADDYLTALEDAKEAEERKSGARDALDGFTGIVVRDDGARLQVTWQRNHHPSILL